jgi:hypothetical protein
VSLLCLLVLSWPVQHNSKAVQRTAAARAGHFLELKSLCRLQHRNMLKG